MRKQPEVIHPAHYSKHEPVKCSKYVKKLALNGLPAAEKQAVWQGIKQQNPTLADMMQNDENLKLVRATFDAVFVMTPEEISGYKGDK